jgi:hypothetical protein
MVASLALSATTFERLALADGPTLQWKSFFGTPGHDFAEAVDVDDAGNAYLAGSTFGALAGANTGQQDVYVSKFSASPSTGWLRQFGSTGNSPFDEGRGVAADDLGGVFVAGGTLGNLEGTNQGDNDAFLRKYDAGGHSLWTRQFGTSSSDRANGVASDSFGNAYVVGQTDGSLGEPNLGSRDAFVRKYDGNGTLSWSRQVGSSLFDVGLGITADYLDNVYIAGFTVAGGGSLPTGDQNALIGKLDSAGNLLWLRSLGTSSRDLAQGAATDNLGNVYIAGTTDGQLGAMSGGSSDAFLAKYDDGGNLVWIKQWGGALREDGLAVATDSLGRAYLAGRILTPSTGPVTRSDAFIVRFDSSGSTEWEFMYDASIYEEFWSLAVDGAGNIYAAGSEAQAVGTYNAILLKLAQVPELASHELMLIAMWTLILRRPSTTLAHALSDRPSQRWRAAEIS